jgi:hypothetical protein
MLTNPCLALCEALAVSLFALQGCALTEDPNTQPRHNNDIRR